MTLYKRAKQSVQKEFFIEKGNYYRRGDPGMGSPEVDWDEFFMDYEDRKPAGQMLSKVGEIETMRKDIKYLRDHDNDTDALRDYSYAQYKTDLATVSVMKIR